MIRRFIFSLIAIAGFATATAQMTPRTVVTTAPEKVLFTIDATVLLDMLDYYESGVARVMKNKAGEDAVITEMTESTISLNTGNAHSISFAILPYGKSQIIMVIDRVCTPSPDVLISFYDSRWTQLPMKKILKMPKLVDWVGKVTDEKMSDIENSLPFLMVDAQYNPDTLTLTFVPQFGDYISIEDVDKVKAALMPQLEYVWSGKSFKRLKK